MHDPAPERGPLSSRERWAFGLFLVILLGLFTAEIVDNYEPVKLSALLVVVFWVPLLALHEAGHAAVAAMLGWNVGIIVIGMGRTVARFSIGSSLVEIRLWPVEGFVQCIPRNLRAPQLKSALIFFAGPGVELLLAAVIYWLIGPEQLLTKSDDYWLITWQSLALASVTQAVLNLLPHAVYNQGKPTISDGLGIIRSFLTPTGVYGEMLGRTFNRETLEWDEHEPADWWKREDGR